LAPSNRKYILLIGFLCLLVILAFSSWALALTNPAWRFCELHGGRGELCEDADRNQYSACLFADGSSCDAFAFHSGACAPQSSPLTWHGPGEPVFDDYPVKVDASSASAGKPVIDQDLADLFALYEFNEVIEESLARPANFAGRLVLTSFGHCGNGCRNFVLVDKLTGKVTMPDLVLFDGTAHFTADSRLLILEGVLDEGGVSDRHYFGWFDGNLLSIDVPKTKSP